MVPVFNEGKIIGTVLRLLSKIRLFPFKAEIIVVDDGSTDNSAAKIEAFPFVKYIRHSTNMGKGAAMETGFKNSAGRVIVIQYGDMEYSPELIPYLVSPILQDKSDVVFGARSPASRKG